MSCLIPFSKSATSLAVPFSLAGEIRSNKWEYPSWYIIPYFLHRWLAFCLVVFFSVSSFEYDLMTLEFATRWKLERIRGIHPVLLFSQHPSTFINIFSNCHHQYVWSQSCPCTACCGVAGHQPCRGLVTWRCCMLQLVSISMTLLTRLLAANSRRWPLYLGSKYI